MDNVWVTRGVYTRDSATHPDRDFAPSCSFDYDLHNHNSAGNSGGPGPHAILADVTWAAGSGPTSPPGGTPNGNYQVASGPSSGNNSASSSRTSIVRDPSAARARTARPMSTAPPTWVRRNMARAPMKFGVDATWTYTP